MRFLLSMVLVSVGAVAMGQFPAPQVQQNPPAPYRPPVSPYLNLLRGGDPSINYYYAVRPGISAGVAPTGSVTSMPAQGYNPLRSGFMPAAANPTQNPMKFPIAGEKIDSIPPSAHPVSFGGVNRYIPGTVAGPTGLSGGRIGFVSNQPPPTYSRSAQNKKP
jgi:hypothetical protein